MTALKELLKQPYWILALGLGAVLVALPCVTFKSGWQWTTHPPTTYWLVGPGAGLLLLSAAAFGFVLWSKRGAEGSDIGTGLNLSHVKEKMVEYGLQSIVVRLASLLVESKSIPATRQLP